MAAGVQQRNGAFGRSIQGSQHAVKVHATQAPIGAGIKVGIGFDHKTGIGEQGAVVFPTRVADQHFGTGVELLQEVGTDFEATRAAHGLHGGHPVGGDGFRARAKHQRFDRRVIGGNAVHGQIIAGLGGGNHGLFSRLHALQQGQLASIVKVHADAQVGFIRVGVSRKLRRKTKNRVWRRHLHRRK